MTTEYPLRSTLIHAATMLVVDDLDISVGFYRDILGFEIVEQEPWIVLLSVNSMLLYLIPNSPPTPDKPNITLANTNHRDATGVILVFRVPDCRAVYEDLQSRGVTFLAEPHEPAWGGWRCFARDPNGYLIEIEQNT